MKRIRLLIVDDSAVVRAVLRRLFRRVEDVTIVAEAADGREAIEAAARERPDVILMDVEMPVLDGYEATERIMAEHPTPIVILTSRANRDQLDAAFEATSHGAVDLFAKPESPQGWEQLAETLPRAVRSASLLTATMPARRRPAATRAVSTVPRALRYVAIGASTGGPGAVRSLLAAFPAAAPLATLVVQHIAPGFEVGLAEWLDRELRLDVRMARDGAAAEPGSVYLAPQGCHLLLVAEGTMRLDDSAPPRHGHRPSIDELLLSCATHHPRVTAGVVLTGMGSDGAAGLAALKQAGGLTVVQDEATSVVFGMPRAALDAGAAELALPPEEIGRSLVECWGGELG